MHIYARGRHGASAHMYNEILRSYAGIIRIRFLGMISATVTRAPLQLSYVHNALMALPAANIATSRQYQAFAHFLYLHDRSPSCFCRTSLTVHLGACPSPQSYPPSFSVVPAILLCHARCDRASELKQSCMKGKNHPTLLLACNLQETAPFSLLHEMRFPVEPGMAM